MYITLLIILFIILSAWYDKGKRFEDHSTRFIIRFAVITTLSMFQTGDYLINFLINTFIFYFIFDYLLNILEKRKWNYIGNTSKIDIFWKKLGWKCQLIFKLTSLVIFILIKIKYNG